MSVEQFFKKPSTRKELMRNMRKLRSIPKDIKEPKVVIKLGGPEKSEKSNVDLFVFMEAEDSQQYFVTLPRKRKKLYRDIVNFSKKFYKKDFNILATGFMVTKNKQLVVTRGPFGFGNAHKNNIEAILKGKFSDVDVVVF